MRNRPAGTTPRGAASEEQAAQWVRGMFASVAHRYDFLNHLLSFQMDRYWRARAVRRVRDILTRPDARALDLCCGTGDLMLALARSSRAAVVGSDFCQPMLEIAAGKIAARGSRAVLLAADALRLPLPDGSVDLATVAFGLRNFANYETGLREMRRVLKPGGTAAILEFTRPPNAAFAALYNFYARRILPWIGNTISGSNDAYTYLPDSVRKFPDAPGLAGEMRRIGFESVEFEYMTGGIVALHVGTAP